MITVIRIPNTIEIKNVTCEGQQITIEHRAMKRLHVQPVAYLRFRGKDRQTEAVLMVNTRTGQYSCELLDDCNPETDVATPDTPDTLDAE